MKTENPLTVESVHELGRALLSEALSLSSLAEIEAFRVRALGKKGQFSELLRQMGSLSVADRPVFGALVNDWKDKIEAGLAQQKARADEAALAAQIKASAIDVTEPARGLPMGSLHPISQVIARIESIFSRLGFHSVTGPEIETDYMCFEAVNIPKNHPSRDMQDTFFLGEGVVLRTQTSSVQTRMLRLEKPPFRIICPGAVYRSDYDATHSPMFHQVEGLLVEKAVKFSDLKGTLEFFAREIFGSETRIRFRPSYFPFVEPGAEVDASCFVCQGKNPVCRVCKGTGWIEILGAGMVHRQLFAMAGLDTKEWSGFAFGLGVERIAMILYGIPDLRQLYSIDPRFSAQFR